MNQVQERQPSKLYAIKSLKRLRLKLEKMGLTTNEENLMLGKLGDKLLKQYIDEK